MTPVLINLSNHKSSMWSSEQMEAAQVYGNRIIDIPFPSVEPSADANIINILADKYVNEILEKTATYSVTVHVMGEMCLTFRIVRKLQDSGIRCIASTTERKVTEQPDGSRISEFHFVRFREYGE